MIKYQFIVEIPNAPDQAAAWCQMKNIAHEGRLGEFVVQIQAVTETPAPAHWQAALRPKHKPKS